MTSAITGTGSAAPARAFDWRNLIKQRYLIIAIAFMVGLPALRIRGMYLALATLAAFYLADFVGQQYQNDTVGAAGFFLKPVFTGTISQQSASWAWLLLGVLAATIILFSWLRSGRSGRAWRMI